MICCRNRFQPANLSAFATWPSRQTLDGLVVTRIASSFRILRRLRAVLVHVLSFVFVIGLVVAVSAQDTNSRIESNAKELVSHGITPDEDGIRHFLKELIPSEEDEKRAIELIQRLSSKDYVERESATIALKQMGSVDIATLELYLKKYAKQAEARYRLQKVIQHRSGENRGHVQGEVFRFIIFNGTRGLLPLIRECNLHLERNDRVRRLMLEAMEVTATESDVDFAVQSLEDDASDADLRTAALSILRKVDSKTANEQAEKLFESATGGVGLQVAHVLVDAENPEVVSLLIRLLGDQDRMVANRSLGVLANMTDLDLGFSGVSREKRVELVKMKIDSFLDENEAELNYEWKISRSRIGHRLISDYSNDVIIELDANGEVVWQLKGVSKPFACAASPDGFRYVALYRTGDVVQIDQNGKEKQRFKGIAKSISGMCLMENGNLLLASGQGNGAITEINSDGKVIRTIKVDGTPTSVEVFSNGNLVCALWGKNEIAVLDSEGKVLRVIEVSDKPYHVAELENGNMLVAFASKGKIAELDSDGKEVWSHDCSKNVYRAHELDDGTIGYADSDGVTRVDRDGKKVGDSYRKAGSTKYMYEF